MNSAGDSNPFNGKPFQALGISKKVQRGMKLSDSKFPGNGPACRVHVSEFIDSNQRLNQVLEDP